MKPVVPPHPRATTRLAPVLTRLLTIPAAARFVAPLLGLLLLSACSDAYEESGPADIILEGRLCAPARDGCPQLKTLHRPNDLGANLVDFRLTNHGTAAEITVIAVLKPDAELDVGFLDGGLPDIGVSPQDPADVGANDDLTGIARSYQLASNESINDRFVPEEILTVSTFGLIIECDQCEASLEYTLATQPLECRTDSHCSSTWVCNRSDGRCVECLADSDCKKTQTCDLDSRQCTPTDLGGCASTPPKTPAPLPTAMLLFFAMGWALKRRATSRRLAHPQRVGARCSLILLAAALSTIALGAQPAAAASPSASVELGVGPRLLTGKLGDDTLRGIGLKVAQQVRTRYFGGQLTLGTSYFVTTQHAPPLSNELQLYSVAIGPQFYLPLGPVELAFGADFRHVGVVTNSLARLSGPKINYLSAGGTLQVRYLFGALAVMLDGGFHPVFGLESSLFSMNIGIGLATD